MERRYDLDDRLVVYAGTVISLTDRLPDTRAGNHIAGQLLRSGTSPAPNYGEASAGESPRDFVHKMKVCLKELHESRAWLRIIAHCEMLPSRDVVPLITETVELIRIFSASISTARRNEKKKRGRRIREQTEG